LEVQAVKFLGVNIDNSLKWDFHIESLSKNLATTNYTLFSLRTFVDKTILFLAYYGLFYSRLSYGIEIGGGE